MKFSQILLLLAIESPAYALVSYSLPRTSPANATGNLDAAPLGIS